MGTHRYLVFAWQAADPAETREVQRLIANLNRASASWQPVLEGAGIAVYCTSGSPEWVRRFQTADSAGVILGTLFSARNEAHSASAAVIDGTCAERIVASAGRELITSFWGNYVAVMQCASTATLRVLHGPMSSLPCLHTLHGGIRIFFSHIEDCMALGLRPFAIDWEYIKLHLSMLLRTRRTGLCGVSELLAGQLFESRGIGHARENTCWDPLDIAVRPWRHSENFARHRLKEATRTCVHAWASAHDSIVLNLSGGLDSSIVLACLRDAPSAPRVTCLNDYSPGSNSDERDYARRMAKHAGMCELIEEPRDCRIALAPMLEARKSHTPQCVYRRVDVAASESRIARQSDATAIFAGSGGDELFFQSFGLAFADYISQRGIRPSVLRRAYEVAQVEGLSIWAALGSGLRRSFRSPAHDILGEAPLETLATAQAMADLKSMQLSDGSWLPRSSMKGPPGKVRQAMALSSMPDYYDPLGKPGDPLTVPPLLSQPLVEVVMEIPSYVLLAGGWERGLARQAFAEELPPEIAWRRDKGDMEDHLLGIIRTNLGFARQLLLDGVLVDQGLIDRQRVADVLDDETPGLLKAYSSTILHYLDIEAWLRSWT